MILFEERVDPPKDKPSLLSLISQVATTLKDSSA